jgi:NACalpha-BTF3-like transcription factor
MEQESGNPCVICHEAEPVLIEPNLELCPTGHTFLHPECLKQWKTHRKGQLFCPICRHTPKRGAEDFLNDDSSRSLIDLVGSLSQEERLNMSRRAYQQGMIPHNHRYARLIFSYPRVNITRSPGSESLPELPSRWTRLTSERTPEENAKIVADQASCSLEKAMETLVKHHGDIIDAIMELTS